MPWWLREHACLRPFWLPRHVRLPMACAIAVALLRLQTELTRVLDLAMNPNSLFAERANKLRGANASVSTLQLSFGTVE